MDSETSTKEQDIYLIPANSKKGLLIMGLFHPQDLIIFGSGVGATILMVILFGPESLLGIIIVLLPALVTALLVTPIPHYHNTLTVILSIIDFYSKREKFKWKGWDFYEEINDTK